MTLGAMIEGKMACYFSRPQVIGQPDAGRFFRTNEAQRLVTNSSQAV